MSTADPSTPPRLTIGLPVYNGEAYLRQALDSILGQTFTDFELILSDNASTDGTQEICELYALKDARVRYIRQPYNVGASENFEHVFAMSRSELFKWAAHDDVLEPSFLEHCIAALDANPEVVLAYTRVAQIDPAGKVVGSYDYPMRVSDPDPLVRFHDLVLTNHFCVAVFGVMRREVLARTRLIDKYVSSDRVLLAEMSLYGPLVELPDYSFYRREHPETSGRYNIYRRLVWFDPTRKAKLTFPTFRLGLEYLKASGRVPLSLAQRLRVLGVLAHWMVWRRGHLIHDLKYAVLVLFPFLRPNLSRVRPANTELKGGKS